MPLEVDFLGEGGSDEAVARALISAAGHQPGRSYVRPMRGTGKDNLDSRLDGLNRGAAFGRPVLVLRDLDHDAPCPSALVAALLPNRHSVLLLRIAVRTVEAWLLADRAAYARYCGVPERVIPRLPETVLDLKGMILGMAERYVAGKLARHLRDCRKRGLADWQSLGEWHATFAAQVWDPARTIRAGGAPSLTRAFDRLTRLASAEYIIS